MYITLYLLTRLLLLQYTYNISFILLNSMSQSCNRYSDLLSSFYINSTLYITIHYCNYSIINNIYIYIYIF